MKIYKKKNLIIFILIFIGCKSTLNHNPSINDSTDSDVEIEEKVPNPKGLRHFMDGL